MWDERLIGVGMDTKVNIKLGGRRDSGIELFRIISMPVIVAHHYVVNSGVMNIVEEINAVTGNTMFALLLGWGGERQELTALF